MMTGTFIHYVNGSVQSILFTSIINLPQNSNEQRWKNAFHGEYELRWNKLKIKALPFVAQNGIKSKSFKHRGMK